MMLKKCTLTMRFSLYIYMWGGGGGGVSVRVVVLQADFNNSSVTSWWLFLLVEETGVTGENHRPAASY